MSLRNDNHFVKAIKFIYNHIDQPITLPEIASAAGLSLSSLKRLFIEVAEQSPGSFIRRLRMELAFCSLQHKNDSILTIALSAGFDDQSAFSRCFKETFGFPPTAARKKLNIVSEFDCVSLQEPDIVELADLAIQTVTEQGIYYESAKNAWENLKHKLTVDELSDDFTGSFIGIGHDNPHEGQVAPDKVRYSAGISLLSRDLKIKKYIIPGGRYARFHYLGKPVNLGLAYHYIYGKWQEQSKVHINSATPAFIVYHGFPEGITEQHMSIHVPLAGPNLTT